MAILGRIADQVSVTADFSLSVTVEYFDDADAANVGYINGLSPRVVLHRESFPYPATLDAADLQAALQTDIKARGQLFERAWNSANAARTLLPVGALVQVDG